MSSKQYSIVLPVTLHGSSLDECMSRWQGRSRGIKYMSTETSMRLQPSTKVWVSPELRTFGLIRDLTASGSGTVSENTWTDGMGGSNCSLPEYNNHFYCKSLRP